MEHLIGVLSLHLYLGLCLYGVRLFSVLIENLIAYCKVYDTRYKDDIVYKPYEKKEIILWLVRKQLLLQTLCE